MDKHVDIRSPRSVAECEERLALEFQGGMPRLWPVRPFIALRRRFVGQVRSGSVQAMMVGSIAGGRFRIRHGYEAFEGQLSATETGSVLVGDITVPLDRLAWMHALPGVFVGAGLGATAGALWAIVGAAVGAVVGAVWGLTSGITWDIFNGPDADANVQQIVEHLQVLAEPERGRKVHEAHLAGDLEWPEGGPSDRTA